MPAAGRIMPTGVCPRGQARFEETEPVVVTTILKRMQPQRQHLTVLVVLLVLSFGMTMSLAWAAWDAARDARVQAEDTMKGWAAMAAEGFKANVEMAVFNGLIPAFQRSLYDTRRDFGAPIEAVAAGVIPAAVCECLMEAGALEFYFRLDLSTGEFESTGDGVDPAYRAWITNRVRSAPAAVVMPDSSAVGIAVGKAAGDERFVAYAVLTDSTTRPRSVIGFSADPATLDQVLKIVWRVAPLLPQANQVNDSLLYAVVEDAAGVNLFATPTAYDTVYGAQRNLAEPLAGARVTTYVRPDASDALIVGGIPEPPIGRLAGLLGITTLLLASSLVLIRREADLARLRADFIAGVSHELRTPLAQIRMFAETLLLGRVRSEGERTRSLEIIDQEARRLAHLVENVLIFAKAERRKSRINPQLTDVPADIREALQGFAVLNRSREIEIRAELQENVAAQVDRGALRQVLLNLLDNAVKYGPLEQRITVGLALFEDNARIWVDDEGPGIPAEERMKVFGRFVRLSRDVDSPVGGSGIGLAIVRELVLLHGGRVWIEDAPGGRGARVVAEFPGAYVRPDAATGGWAVA